MAALSGITLVGLGDPVMDVLVRLSHDELSVMGLEAGGCTPVNAAEMEALLSVACQSSSPLRIPGGSAANVMKGVASISAGSAVCKFIGMVGKDVTGAGYRSMLKEQHVEPLMLESTSGQPSAVSLCLVTPDGQRTMRTCLGASLELQAAAQLGDARWADGCRLLHCEGYCLYRPQLTREMMVKAKAAGALVSIDLASFELVRNCNSALTSLLEAGLVDLLFANEEEAVTLCHVLGLEPADSTASKAHHVSVAQQYLLRYCRVAVVSLGPRGCVAQAADGERGQAPAGGVKVADTIGAGDYFTAGFLCAYLVGATLQQCCASGCASGSEAVQATGAQLGPEAVGRVQRAIADILRESGGQGNGGAGQEAAAAAAAVVGLPPLAEPVLV